MRHPASCFLYSSFHPDSFRVCETSRADGYRSGARFLRWTEEELERIRMVLKKLTAVRVDNPEDAEDLVQETLLTMVRKAPGTDLEKGPLIWAMGILRKKVGNYYRKTQRNAALETHSPEILGHRPGPSFVLSPEASLHHAELRAVVDGAIARLSPREREAIDLLLSGRQTGEIVTLLRPERYQNIVNWLHRGRKKIARELARHGYQVRDTGRCRRGSGHAK